jgi:hypothetical protein
MVLETTQKIIDMLYTPTYSSNEKISKMEKKIIDNHLKEYNKTQEKGYQSLDID